MGENNCNDITAADSFHGQSTNINLYVPIFMVMFNTEVTSKNVTKNKTMIRRLNG